MYKYTVSKLQIYTLIWRYFFILQCFSSAFCIISHIQLRGNIPLSREEQNSGIVVHSEFPWQVIVLTINACEYEVPDSMEVSCYSEVDVRNTMAVRAVWGMVQHYHSLEENKKITRLQTCTYGIFLLNIITKHCTEYLESRPPTLTELWSSLVPTSKYHNSN